MHISCNSFSLLIHNSILGLPNTFPQSSPPSTVYFLKPSSAFVRTRLRDPPDLIGLTPVRCHASNQSWLENGGLACAQGLLLTSKMCDVELGTRTSTGEGDGSCVMTKVGDLGSIYGIYEGFAATETLEQAPIRSLSTQLRGTIDSVHREGPLFRHDSFLGLGITQGPGDELQYNIDNPNRACLAISF